MDNIIQIKKNTPDDLVYYSSVFLFFIFFSYLYSKLPDFWLLFFMRKKNDWRGIENSSLVNVVELATTDGQTTNYQRFGATIRNSRKVCFDVNFSYDFSIYILITINYIIHPWLYLKL